MKQLNKAGLPESVVRAAEECARGWPSDPARACEEAERRVRDLPEFGALVDALVRGAVQDLVHDTQHRDNVAAKRAAGEYGKPGKVSAAGPAVVEAYRSVYESKQVASQETKRH